MPETKKKKYRLFKVAKELNLGSGTIVDFLQKEGFDVQDKPNANLKPEMYEAVLEAFADEKRIKEKAESAKGVRKEEKGSGGLEPELVPLEKLEEDQPDEITPEQLKTHLATDPAQQPASEEETSTEEEHKSFAAGAEAELVARDDAATFTDQPASPSPEDTAESETAAPPAETEKAEAEAPSATETTPEAESEGKPGLKVVGKIDLDSLGKKKGKKKAAKPEKEAGKKKKPEQEEVPQLGLFGAEETPKEPAVEETSADTKAAAPEVRAEDPATKQPAPEETTPQAEEPPPAKESVEPAATAEESSAPAAPKEEPVSEQPATEKPAVEGTPQEGEPQKEESQEESTTQPELDGDGKIVRASESAPQLQGLKIMGKIDLGSSTKKKGKQEEKSDKSSSNDGGEAGKRKRRRRKRKKAVSPVSASGGTDNKKGGKKGGGKREEVSEEAVDKKLKSTLAQMSKGASRKRQKLRREKRDARARQREQEELEQLESENVLEVTEFLTASELAKLMDVNVNQVIAKCMELGYMVSINQRMDQELIELIADEFGYQVEFSSVEEFSIEVEEEEEDDPADLLPRAPIVTVMGHVDHGKTSLLDHVRKTNVIAGESGGITQHIGAYEVTLANGKNIAFLDTPGHEAFTAMRARGAQVTDIAIIVIAADDRVMPQTKEAINHAQAAGVPMVFAINKVDKPAANPEKIKEELAGMNLLVEDWGGKFQSQDISAKKGSGIEDLLEKVLLEAELLELQANPDKNARGTIIEAQLDKGRGVVSTLLVQSGTLKIGEVVLANCFYGRVKAMLDERGNNVEEAGPSTPVQILGLNGVPTAGDKFQVFDSDKEARQIAQKREQLLREQRLRTTQSRMSLEKLSQQAGDIQDLNVIVKGDVDGSVEALADSLIKLSNEEVNVNIVMRGVGQISESDVHLASASDAIIIGFQVRPSPGARHIIQNEGIDLRTYSVIYDAINDVKDAMEGMLAPEIEEKIVGIAEVRDIFKISKVGTIAGCRVTEGMISRNNRIRLIRDGVVTYEGQLGSLKRHKEDAKEVVEGYECGIGIENFNDIKVGDVIESYTTVEVKRTLS